jgi:hypothetical protein
VAGVLGALMAVREPHAVYDERVAFASNALPCSVEEQGSLTFAFA